MTMSVFSFNYIQQKILRKPYGIHSPFLYSFASKCLFNDTREEVFSGLEAIRLQLRQDTREIEVTDYGKGPRFMRQRREGEHQPLVYRRRVGQIARRSLQPARTCRLLYRMVRYFEPESILELGTSLGITSSYLALAQPACRVITLEGCPQTAAIARQTFSKAAVENVELLLGDFTNTLPQALEKMPSPGMVYLDGDHSFEGVLRNFTAISNHLQTHSVVVVDDINWSRGMMAAWKQLVAWERTTLALDLGRTGILFFNTALSKQLIRIGF